MQMRAAYKPGPRYRRYRWPFWLMIAVVAALGYFTYSYFNGETNSAYLDDLMRYRKERQRFISEDPLSPWAEKDNKPVLKFFRPDMSWRLEADLNLLKVDSIQIQRIKSMEKAYKVKGFVKFHQNNSLHQLTVLQSVESPDSGHVFIPFFDQTSGKETFLAGRYLDLAPEAMAATHVLLDFNLAYQPFCAYDSTLVCPMPPGENRLLMEVRAGERE